MKLKMSELCAGLLYSLIVKVIANICVDEIDHLLTKELVLNHPILRDFKTGDVITCAQSCIRVKSCRSFNFNDETHVCQLFQASGTPSIADKKGVYSEIDTWPTQTDPHCYHRPCTNDEICISGSVTDDGSCSYSCFKNARSCPVPIGGNPIDQARTEGSIFRHTCGRGYVGGDSAICLTTGEWNKTLDTNCELLFENQCDEETDCLPINGTCQRNKCQCGSGQDYDTSLIACVNECALPWIRFQRHCYLFIDEMHQFDEASERCISNNSDMVYVETMEENEFLKSEMRNKYIRTMYWNCLHAFYEEDGTRVLLLKTLNGNLEPKFYDWGRFDPHKGDHRCTVFYGHDKYNYQWADHFCDIRARLVCKKMS